MNDGRRLGLGVGLRNSLEFNRRALIALRTVDLQEKAAAFVESCRRTIDGNGDLSPKGQQWLYDLVHRHRRQITDQPVLDYAAQRARGAD